jgi:ATP-dependent DNA helicase RecG
MSSETSAATEPEITARPADPTSDLPSPSVPPPAGARLDAALALDVVRRTVRYGLRAAPGRAGPRYLSATCSPWLARVPDDVLEPRELAVLGSMREALARFHEPGPAPVELLKDLDDGLGALASLLTLVESQRLEPLAALLPEGEGDRAELMRKRQAELEEKRKAREKLPPVTLPDSDEPSEAPPPRPRDEEREPAQQPASASDAADSEEPASERKSRRRRRGRKRQGDGEHVGDEAPAVERGADTPEPEPQPEPEPEPEPVPIRAINDPEGAGMELAGFFPALGGTLLERLAGHGVRTVADLLQLCPADYRVLPRAVGPSESLSSGQHQVLRGTVLRRLSRLSPLGSRHEVVLGDGQAEIVCRWVTPRDEDFWATVTPGSRVALHGLVETDGELALLHEGEAVWVDSRGQGRQACYQLDGISDSELSALIRPALEAFADRILDPLPEVVRKRMRLLDLGDALRRLHFPTHGARRGLERLAFDELLLYQIGHSLGHQHRPRQRGIGHSILHRLVGQIMASRPHALSDGQEIAFSEIRRDLAKPTPMNRLLQGDVGVGKGFVALLTAVVVAEGRGQVVFVAPDALAAEHRFLFAEPLLRSVGLVPALLLDKPDNAQIDALRRGEYHVVFTTPAIATDWPSFRRLGLVVVEEREEYGTVAASDLPSQGARPDLLVLTDAPIPSSIALTVFGDMDLSLVPGQHITGLEVSSHPWADHMDAYAQARGELEAGRQVYVVLPMISGHERLNQRELARFADALRGDAFPGARIGVFSGVMSREERHRTYEDFLHRRIDVLLTTTIIEDGPAVPNATVSVVLEADRFDLVRLHRLRAHVARGVKPGRCLFVLSEQPDPEGVRQVEMMVNEHDAFRVAELDLAARGAQALLGERADELPSFRYMDPLEHRDLLVRARQEAFQLLGPQRELSRPDLGPLRAALEESWQRWFPGQPSFGAKRPSSNRGRSGRRRRRRGR